MQPLFVPSDYFRELRPEELFVEIDRPLEIDLGCGDGTFIVNMAANHPDRNFLGVERNRGRVSITANKIKNRGLSNARVMRLESAYTVSWLLPAAGVSRLHLLCPDPWPKKKHAERRMVNRDEFLDGLERILVPGGEFMLKTDDRVYFDDAAISFATRPSFELLEWPEDLCYYPTTDFEKQWIAQGREIYRERWRRK